ncbi:MAG: hypothetical protein V4632_01895 [Pseudomonadota bacterium]
MTNLPFTILLYRYFFFGWLFKDVNNGNIFQRSVAWQHNREQAKWLSTYLRRWLFMGGLSYGLGALCETFFHAPALAAFFFVPMAVSVSVNTVIGALMLGFKSLSGPL